MKIFHNLLKSSQVTNRAKFIATILRNLRWWQRRSMEQGVACGGEFRRSEQLALYFSHLAYESPFKYRIILTSTASAVVPGKLYTNPAGGRVLLLPLMIHLKRVMNSESRQSFLVKIVSCAQLATRLHADTPNVFLILFLGFQGSSLTLQCDKSTSANINNNSKVCICPYFSTLYYRTTATTITEFDNFKKMHLAQQLSFG